MIDDETNTLPLKFMEQLDIVIKGISILDIETTVA